MQMFGKARSKMVACGIVSLLAALNASAVEQPTVTELLKPLNLSGYASGMRPPEFSGRTSDGKMLSLTGLREKVVVVNFWATWCLECRPEMPMFERLHREFGAQGLSVIGINAREGAAAVRVYAKELGLTFPLILDPSGKINSAYGVIGLPTTFLIGRDGRPVALAVGPREWSGKAARALIQVLLAEPAPLKETRSMAR
ncbi:MAG TPA: TlpA disulfide reductase family protein [Candidatus Binatia bacterium]|nr:TlpA disulfide reductase family protein [Candidatus Binatia bacterium]